ncbi:hypothetical protein B0T25DRAFT_557459 [Lasiosphaeria hispida]|uniref:Uncharacterized protein n=1 Tax=Lasiosphaeria hispida TaxID=260671 RepID=A0AAJ0H5N2_9PEZI|nr:hypothetical protein B0T25DRAFT_557459 [Lasiosphaeria hispida]
MPRNTDGPAHLHLGALLLLDSLAIEVEYVCKYARYRRGKRDQAQPFAVSQKPDMSLFRYSTAGPEQIRADRIHIGLLFTTTSLSARETTVENPGSWVSRTTAREDGLNKVRFDADSKSVIWQRIIPLGLEFVTGPRLTTNGLVRFVACHARKRTHCLRGTRV